MISVTHTHTHIYNIMYIDCHSHLSFSARVFSVTGGCGFNYCRRSFRLLVFIWTFTFASCPPLHLAAVVTARVLKDDVIGIGWVWQKLLSWTHLSKQLTSLWKKERVKKDHFEFGLSCNQNIKIIHEKSLYPSVRLSVCYHIFCDYQRVHRYTGFILKTWCYLISSFFVSDGGVGFRGQIEPMWSRLVGVVNAVEVHVVIERPEEAWSGA